MHHSTRRLVSTTAVAVLACTLGLPAVSRAAVGDLYAATGAGGGGNYCGAGTLSSLYTLDPTNGAATLVAPIEIGDTQVRHVTGLAFHPSTGVLYGIMNGQDTGGSDCSDATLITIDPATGAATIVGSQGSLDGPIPDITFDSFGTLYAWSEYNDDLFVVDITDGTATTVASALSSYATGLASDSDGRLYVKVDNQLMRMNQYTGVEFDWNEIDRYAHNLLAFDASDVLFSGERSSEGLTLFTIDRETGATTVKGTNTIKNIGAIEFNRGTVTEPPVSDLSLAKEVDEPAVLVGEDVVFTLTLANDGPDAADNVVVHDPLPPNFSFVSATGEGSYDDQTGEWTLASVAASSSAVIEITATASQTGEYVNAAEVVASDSYDPDSVAGSGDVEADMYAQVEATVVVPKLFSIDRWDPYLWVVDDTFEVLDGAQELSLDGHSICGGNGLAAAPVSGTLYGVLAVDDCSTRTLVTIDPVTADATEVGDFGGTRIAAIAFGADDDTLYATSGNNGDVETRRTLFSVDPATGALTAECKLESSSYGRSLAFADGLLYDATYECDSICQLVVRVIDPASFPADPADTCPGTTIETGLGAEPTGMTVKEVGLDYVILRVSSFYSMYSVTIPGTGQPADVSFLGSTSHDSKGLAYSVAPVSLGNLTTQKSATKSRSKGDKFIEYLLQASNSGPDDIDGVVLTDVLPFGTTLVSTGSCNESGGVVTCDVGTLGSGQTVYHWFTVQVTCKKCSSISNTVEIGAENVYDYPYDNSWGIDTSVKGKF